MSRADGRKRMGGRSAVTVVFVVVALGASGFVQAGSARPSDGPTALSMREPGSKRNRLAAAVRTYLKRRGAPANTRTARALVDLDGDGRRDGVVLLFSDHFCGTGGCTLAVFANTRAGYGFVSRSTLVSRPVRVSTASTHGWRKLIVRVRGGGGPSADRVLSFDGNRYPLNASLQPRATRAAISSSRVLIRG
jgi:putative lipoprotein